MNDAERLREMAAYVEKLEAVRKFAARYAQFGHRSNLNALKSALAAIKEPNK